MMPTLPLITMVMIALSMRLLRYGSPVWRTFRDG